MFPGKYPALVYEAEDKTSQAGNDMIVASILCLQPNGMFEIVKDYILTKTENTYWKREAVSKAIGCDPDNMTPKDLVGSFAEVIVEIEESKDYGTSPKIRKWQKGKPSTDEKNSLQNEAKKILHGVGEVEEPQVQKHEPVSDDEIPF